MDSLAGDLSFEALDRDLKYTINYMADNEVETIGIGINSNSVVDYYPDSIVINNAKELISKSLDKLKQYLML